MTFNTRWLGARRTWRSRWRCWADSITGRTRRDADGGTGADVPLEVQIEKRLPEFTLDVTFTCGDEPLSVLGPSGAGKTMLLRCIAGLERAQRGRVALGRRVLFDSSQGVHLAARDRRVGMLFQHFALFPHKTVGENVAFGLQKLPRQERLQRVTSLLER